MSIIEEKTYWIQCDNCKKKFTMSFEKKKEAIDHAVNHGWFYNGYDCYCFVCHEYDQV